MPFITVRGIRIYYQIQGKGLRLLVISGTRGDLRQKPSIFESPLAAHFEILAYDQRGLGRTDKPDTPYTMADYAMDAAGLLDSLKWNHCNVMGISFGGMVAQEFALQHRDRVERLVLACSSSGGPGGSSYPLHELTDLPLPEKARRIVELGDGRRSLAWREAYPEQYRALLDQMIQNLKIGANEAGRRMGERRQLEARKGHDTYSRLPDLTMPVFICGGRYDIDVCPVKNLEWLHRQIPHAQFELFEGGHLFFLQDPHAFREIIAFLKGGTNQS
jgi:3-oxoadipate enol-lactonase